MGVKGAREICWMQNQTWYNSILKVMIGEPLDCCFVNSKKAFDSPKRKPM